MIALSDLAKRLTGPVALGTLLAVLCYLYQDTFWLWFNRSFEVAFWIYVIAVLYGIYKFIPLIGSSIVGSVLTFFTSQNKSEKMTALGQKGVEARQQKAEESALIAMVSVEDPLKGIISELVPSIMAGVRGDLPAYVRKGIEARVKTAIMASPINITNAVAPPVIKFLDEKVTALSGGKVHLAEELKALGVLSNAEKVAE